MSCRWKKQRGDCSDLTGCSEVANHGEMSLRWLHQKFERDERISMQSIDRYVRQPWRMEASQLATDLSALHSYSGTPILHGPGYL